MRTGIRNRMITFLSLILSVCMLIGAAFAIAKTTVKAENTTASVIQVEGASVRIVDEDTSGIRFRGRLDKQWFANLYNQYDGKVKAGMIIVPTEYISAANGYAFGAFEAAGKTVAFSTVDNYVLNGDYYEFGVSLINIYANNYARNFEGIVYVEIESDTAVSYAEEFGGKYYFYAIRQTDYARNIYEVAKSAFNDRVDVADTTHTNEVDGKYCNLDADGLAVVKGYVDGVADIEIVNDVPKIANNTAYYTSPYTLTVNSKTGDYLLNGSPKSLIVDGERQTDMHVEKGSVEMHVVRTNQATIANDGTVTLASRKVNSGAVVGIGASGQLFGLIEGSADYTAGGPISYLGFAGEYGVGTYMDFYFTGNNMPEVMFFADIINERLTGYTGYSNGMATSTGEKGVLISNGMYNNINNLENTFTIWGPNRMFYGDGATLSGAITSKISNAAYSLSDGSLLTQATLAEETYADTEFKYTLGTYKHGKNLGVHVILYTISGETTTKVVDNTIDTGIALTEISAGNVICYQTIKSDDTVFKYTAPYQSEPAYVISKGSIDSTGTVTLTGATMGNRMCNVWQIDSAYYAHTGEYGVGTKVDVYFTGNNMPEVLFFANNINGNMTGFESMETASPFENNVKGDNYGLLFSNGFASSDANVRNANGAADRFTVWGMNRIYAETKLENGFRDALAAPLFIFAETTNNGHVTALTNTPCQNYFADNASVRFKYTVGTYEDADGYMAIYVQVTNLDTNAVFVTIDKSTNILAKDVVPGSIIFYDTVKGASNNTVFSVSEPHK